MGKQNATAPVPPAPLCTVLDPFLTLAARTSSGTTYKRVQSALFDPLLDALSSAEDRPPGAKRIRLEDGATSEQYPNLVLNSCFADLEMEGKIGKEELRKKLLRKIFEVASEPDTRDSSRRKMYALWKNGADEDEEG